MTRVNIKEKSNIGLRFPKFFYLSILVVTTCFYTTFADPFNVPKLIALLFSGSWFLGFIIISGFVKGGQKTRFFESLVIIFLFIMFMRALTTENRIVGFFGDGLRRDGFLTYLMLSILSIFLARFFTIRELDSFFKYIVGITFIVSIYGLAQRLNLDFVNWTKSGGIISFFGNSNFAGAVLIILGTLNLSAVFYFGRSKKLPLVLVNLLLALLAIKFTNARQAQLIAIFIFILTGLYLVYRKNRTYGILLFIPLIITIFIALLGIFNKGPLASFLYKESITIRIFYWKAAFRMLIKYPLSGVGIDRYGSYFKEFRDLEYPLRYGFDITSSNAHNVPLQMFATGGFPLGVMYLFMVGYVVWRSLKTFKLIAVNSKLKLVFLTLFLSWIAFQLQSLVSIDNIAVALWGWLLTGILIGISSEFLTSQPNRVSNKFGFQTAISSVLVVPALVISFMLAKVESNVFKLRGGYQPANSQTAQGWIGFAEQTLKLPLIDASYRTAIGGNLLDYKSQELGIQVLLDSIKKDSRDLYAMWGLALNFELNGNLAEAIKYRQKIETLDPWNAKNYLQLARDLKLVGNSQDAIAYARKILSFAPETEFGIAAQKEFLENK